MLKALLTLGSPTPVSTTQIYAIGPVITMALFSRFLAHFPASEAKALSVSIG